MLTPAEALAEAKEAYHRLLTGAAAASFTDQNGERVEYQAASAPRLAAYIAQLESEIAGAKRPHTIRVQTSKGI